MNYCSRKLCLSLPLARLCRYLLPESCSQYFPATPSISRGQSCLIPHISCWLSQDLLWMSLWKPTASHWNFCWLHCGNYSKFCYMSTENFQRIYQKLNVASLGDSLKRLVFLTGDSIHWWFRRGNATDHCHRQDLKRPFKPVLLNFKLLSFSPY